MDCCSSTCRPRLARSFVPLLIYLVAFTVLLIVICQYYLLPAMEVAKTATPEQRRMLAVNSRLLLTLLLIILMGMLLVALRSANFLRRRLGGPRKPTVYPDAWSESARRLKTPPEED
jgi:hypothetical protein